MPTLDEHIAMNLRESLANGELRSAPSWGKPLPVDEGFEQTPDELRLGFKMLKEAGYVPPEVETMKRIAALREVVATETDPEKAAAMLRRLAELQQHLALRLEKLRATGSL
jgi:hypothetical protein